MFRTSGQQKKPFTRLGPAHGLYLSRFAHKALAAALVMMVMVGCAAQSQAGGRFEIQQIALNDTHGELEEQIRDFVDYYQATIEHAAVELERKAATADERRAAILLRVRLIAQCRAAADQPDPKERLLDLWALSQRTLDYLSKGAGKKAFGERQPVALEAAQAIHAAVESLARRCIAEDSFEGVSRTVQAYAGEHPMQDDFSRQPALNLSDEPRGEALQELVGLPLAPLTALAGVGRTPDSIRSVSRSVDRFADVAEDLPANARWQLQLLAMNLGESPPVVETLASLHRFSESSSTLAGNSTELMRVAEEMPEKLRTQTELLLDRLDASQPQLQTTLGEAVRTVESVSQAGDRVRDASESLERAAVAVTETAREVLKFIPSTMKDETGQIIGKPPEATPEPGDQDASFSFQAVGRSAEALGETADKLRDLLADLQVVLDDGSLSREAAALDLQWRNTTDITSLKLQGIIDHVAKRAAQLLCLLFGLLVGYRLLIRRGGKVRADST
jgi:hypothetical protein